MYLKKCKKEYMRYLGEIKGKGEMIEIYNNIKMKRKIKIAHIKLDYRTPSNHNSVIVGNFNIPYVLIIMS